MSDLARQLIRENIEKHQRGENATLLDLGNCGLTEIPEEIGDCAWVEVLSFATESIYWDGRKWQSKKSLNVGGFNNVSKLPASIIQLKKLKKLDISGVENQKFNLTDLSIVSELKNLQSLTIRYTYVSDLSPLIKLISLREFSCRSSQVSDLSPLSSLKNLQTISCYSSQVSDLLPLSNLTALQKIEFGSTQVSDLLPLSNLTALQTIGCSYTQVSDLSPLSNLIGLQAIYCGSTKVSDLSPLSNLTALQTIECGSTQVSDLSPLSNLTALQTINCHSTQVSDLSPLSKLTALQTIECGSTQVSDLSPLSNLTALQAINCNSTQISDLSPLSNLAALETIFCSSTQVSDLSPLSNLTALQAINCNSTQISDLSPLSNLAALKAIFCSSTQVSDLSPLSNLAVLQTIDCDSTQVSNLSPLSNLAALQTIECGSTRVSDLTPLSNLMALYRVRFGSTQVSDLSPLSKLTALLTIECGSTQVSDLSPLSNLTTLHAIGFSYTEVSDLSPLSNLMALQEVYSFSTKVSDLSPLSNLTALQTINCGSTQVSNLSPLSSLIALQTINCYSTQVTDLSPLSKLTGLQTIYCGSTQVSDLSPLSNLKTLQTINCNSTQVTDLSPLSKQTGLEAIYCDSTQVSDLSPLSNLTALQTIDCSSTQVSDLSPLSSLTSLKAIYCGSMQVSNLSPLSNLLTLQTIYCYSTQIADLAPLSNLKALQTINCNSTLVTDLSPLSKLPSLEAVYCGSTQVSDLSPLSSLTSLKVINCGSTLVSDLTPLSSLKDLQSISCQYTQVLSLMPLKMLNKLNYLDIDNTKIGDLSPLSELYNLQNLYCTKTLVSDLSPLKGLRNLQVLDLRFCRRLQDSSLNPIICILKEGISLKWEQRRSYAKEENGFFVFGTRLSPNMVAAIRTGNQSVLDYSTRKKVPLYETRVLVLGEPRAGKTTLRLKLKDCNAAMPSKTDSTKGIAVDIDSLNCAITAEHLATVDTPKLHYHLWDFGGQEMYKILHQMFVTEGAAYIIVTNTDVNKNEDELEFWLETIEKLGKSTRGDDGYGPVIFFQNPQTDREEYQSFRGLREKFKFWKQEKEFVINLNTIGNKTEEDKQRYNPAALKKFREFKAYLEEQLQTLSHIGEEIPEEWVKIRRKLGKLLVRNYISLDEFRNICTESGIADSEEQLRLSRTLHILGVLMHYQENEVLGNMVILNRQWASDALYQVLDDKIVTANKGWFARTDAKKIWGDPKYKDKTNELLELMQEFKMCYLNESVKRYVVPSKLQLDPPETPVWDEMDNVRLHLQYDWLPRPVVTQLMVTLHKHIAEEQSWIWRRGAVIQGGELDAKDAHARIVENLKENKIEISAKGQLSEHLIKSIMDKWREVNHVYDGKVVVSRIILCNCEKCKEAKTPFEFDYEDVLEAKAANETLKCNKSRREMTASEILRGVFDEKTVSQDFKQKFPQLIIHNEMKIENIHQHGTGQMIIADQNFGTQHNLILSSAQFDKYVEILELPEEKILEIKQIEKAVTSSGLDEERILLLLEDLEKCMQEIKAYLPIPIVDQFEEVKKLQTGMSLDGKFKASIPIIPFILNYEFEAKNNLKDTFRQIWEDMKNGEYFLKKRT